MRAPFTLIRQKTGMIGRITTRSGRIKPGQGVRACRLKTMGCGVSGRIGRIGRMFATYAHAREVDMAKSCKAIFFIQRLKSSSLSSLSSLNGIQDIEKNKKQVCGSGEIILPETALILPILPDLSCETQDLVSSGIEGTK